MKFQVSSRVLLRALEPLSALAKANATLPICENVLFDLTPERLLVTATDLQKTLSVTVEVQTRDTHRICIPAYRLMKLLKSLPEQPVTFRFVGSDDAHAVEIVSESGRYRLSGENPMDFPKTPTLDPDATTLRLSIEVLRRGLAAVSVCTSKDALRPAMTALLFQAGPDGLRFVATDGHRLGVYTHSGTRHDRETRCLIPRATVELLTNHLLKSSDEGVLTLALAGQHASFSVIDYTLISRLVDEVYPDYEQAIPKSSPLGVKINVEAFHDALHRVALLENVDSHIVACRFEKGTLTLKTEDLTFGHEGTETLALEWPHEPFEIGFNSALLKELLKTLTEPTMTVQLAAPNRAAVLLPDVASNESLKLLAMPVLLNAYA